MSRVLRYLVAVALIFGLGLLASPALLFAQTATETPAADEDVPPTFIPLVVINVASFERVLTDIDFIFDTADRPELSDFVKSWLGNLGDLKGFDRTKPFGVMLCLKNALPPTVAPVAFVPVGDLDEMLKTISLGPAKPKKIADGKYELVDPNNPQKVHMIIRDGYALGTNNEEILEEMPDPRPFAERLSARYDLAISLRIQAVPSLLRTAFLGFLKTQSQAELQRKDGEREGTYRMRKANGLSTLEFFEQALTQLDQLTLGLDASKELRKGVVELSFEATPDSDMAKQLKDFAGEQTTFHSLFDDSAPLSVSACWRLDKREKAAMTEMVEGLRLEIRDRFDDPDAPIGIGDRIADSLKATIETGAMDFFVQFLPVGEKSFALVGGAKIIGGTTLGNGVREVFTKLKDSGDLASLELDVANHDGVAFHKLVGKDIPKREQRVYGGVPGLYLGIGDRTLWFTVGADNAMTALEGAMDRFAASLGVTPPPGTVSPFQMVFRMAPWLKLPPEEDDGANPQLLETEAEVDNDPKRAERRIERAARRAEFRADLAESVNTAFEKPGTDAIRANTQPTDSGARFRIELDESFLRFFGLRIAQRIDRSQL